MAYFLMMWTVATLGVFLLEMVIFLLITAFVFYILKSF